MKCKASLSCSLDAGMKQLKPVHNLIFFRFTLILFSHSYLGLGSGHLSLNVQANILYVFIVSPFVIHDNLSVISNKTLLFSFFASSYEICLGYIRTLSHRKVDIHEALKA
jgi:hypothetical protein